MEQNQHQGRVSTGIVTEHNSERRLSGDDGHSQHQKQGVLLIPTCVLLAAGA